MLSNFLLNKIIIQNKQIYYYAKCLFKHLLNENIIDHIAYTKMIKKLIQKYGDFEGEKLQDELAIVALKSDICNEEETQNER